MSSINNVFFLEYVEELETSIERAGMMMDVDFDGDNSSEGGQHHRSLMKLDIGLMLLFIAFFIAGYSIS